MAPTTNAKYLKQFPRNILFTYDLHPRMDNGLQKLPFAVPAHRHQKHLQTTSHLLDNHKSN